MGYCYCSGNPWVLYFSTLTKPLFILHIAHKFEMLGIGEFGRLFGAIELPNLVLYLYPKIIGLGFVLLCSYFGGAIAMG
ncbi:hypothetical protein [Pontibacter vulgaris]|uniref:hypothetical protein n=1 Tax=Pontibacter vulgaris TaxID=2905679 RepID=UPI001FA6F0A0|nr:hypothetical protein [Pontibacter vulgaris]